MNNFLKRWLAWRNKKNKENEKKHQKSKELETLIRLQSKKRQLDKIRSDKSPK